jgi:hypothetical protein
VELPVGCPRVIHLYERGSVLEEPDDPDDDGAGFATVPELATMPPGSGCWSTGSSAVSGSGAGSGRCRRVRWPGSRTAARTTAGALLDVGRTSYRPPAALAEYVRTRDRTCRFPGCRRQAERCDLDHVRRHPDVPTSRCNLCTECRHHHRLEHDAGWYVSTDPDSPDTLIWTTRTGRVYSAEPRPPLEPG